MFEIMQPDEGKEIEREQQQSKAYSCEMRLARLSTERDNKRRLGFAQKRTARED
jgi:hypothetical protein